MIWGLFVCATLIIHIGVEQSYTTTKVGKLSGVRGGGATSPSAWKIQLSFQGKRKLLKNPECKTYIKYNENFQGKRKILKNPERYKIFEYSENFQGKLCFSGQAQIVQILNYKK